MDQNYRSYINKKHIHVGNDANIFGLSWIIDGETIHCMPLVNNLVMCADVSLTVVDIHDCTEYMDVGVKKGAKYLSGVMEEDIVKCDPERMHTNFSYVDGASNVQKGVLILCAFYPRAYVFHGGEHVISLIFSGIAKIAPIKVSTCAFIFFVYFYTIILYCLTLKLLQILILKVGKM